MLRGSSHRPTKSGGSNVVPLERDRRPTGAAARGDQDRLDARGRRGGEQLAGVPAPAVRRLDARGDVADAHHRPESMAGAEVVGLESAGG